MLQDRYVTLANARVVGLSAQARQAGVISRLLSQPSFYAASIWHDRFRRSASRRGTDVDFRS